MCRLTGEDLNAWMVREGWALAFERTPKGTCPISKSPAPNSVGFGLALLSPPGIGGTVIQDRSAWRDRCADRAQHLLINPASAVQAPSPNCIIKGNVNRRGERIYFLPGQLDYPRVNMDKPGTQRFCTEDEAKSSGWRPAAR